MPLRSGLAFAAKRRTKRLPDALQGWNELREGTEGFEKLRDTLKGCATPRKATRRSARLKVVTQIVQGFSNSREASQSFDSVFARLRQNVCCGERTAPTCSGMRYSRKVPVCLCHLNICSQMRAKKHLCEACMRTARLYKDGRDATCIVHLTNHETITRSRRGRQDDCWVRNLP
eukprot:3777055-Pleurochrysis_carterae.AAC.2